MEFPFYETPMKPGPGPSLIFTNYQYKPPLTNFYAPAP